MAEAERETREGKLESLCNELASSSEISAARGSRRLVFGTGNPMANLVLIGEAPGAQEDRAGRPFVGPAGRLLDEALADAGLDRDAVWITNTVKFRPTTEGTNGRLKNRPPTPEEVRLFRPWLERELAIVAPSALLCLGATAASAVLDRAVKITQERGSWVPGPRDIPTMPTYHPAFLLRRMGNWEERYDQFVADLRAAASRA